MRRVPRGEDGTALIEFTFLAVLLLVPLVYGMLTAFAVQRAAFAVSAAAREAGRAYVTAADVESAQDRADFAARLALEAHGIDAGDHPVRFPDGHEFVPGGRTAIVVGYSVDLPLLPASIPVSSRFIAVIDRFRPALS